VHDEQGELRSSGTKVRWKDGQAPAADSRSFFAVFFGEEHGDAELAEALKEEIWPNPMPFFLGEFKRGEESLSKRSSESALSAKAAPHPPAPLAAAAAAAAAPRPATEP
jgi:hypothetical protein